VPTQLWVARVVLGPITPSTASLPRTVTAGRLAGWIAERVLERDTVMVAPRLARLSPARWPQVPQAPGPCAARTRWAVAIWAALLARLARDAKRVPPYALQVELENCSPP